MSVADIKNKAKENVLKQATKVSAATLLHVARDQFLRAKDAESSGDLPVALEGYIKTAALLKMTMDSPELKQEKPKGVLRKEMTDFLNVCHHALLLILSSADLCLRGPPVISLRGPPASRNGSSLLRPAGNRA
jgi:hypothetical protein